jgi:hypothetical protein
MIWGPRTTARMVLCPEPTLGVAIARQSKIDGVDVMATSGVDETTKVIYYFIIIVLLRCYYLRSWDQIP